MSSDTPHQPSSRFLGSIILLCALSGVAIYSFNALRVVVWDGAGAALIVASAAGFGNAILTAMRTTSRDRMTHLVIACGVGMGLLSLLMLALGSMGHMSRELWLGILCLGAVLFAVAVWRYQREARESCEPAATSRMPHVTWLLLVCSVPLVLALMGATLPPGLLWPEEGNGYDVLEYHLGGPKEYLGLGRIQYLPHNIYMNFPLNAEMLYLVGMIARGGALKGIYVAQMLHLAMGVLTVIAVACAAKSNRNGSAIIAACLAATTPFLCYLSGIAYVENGMLLMLACALLCVREAARSANASLRWCAIAGLLAGFACGFKYPATVMVLAPISAAMLMLPRQKAIQRLMCGAVVALCGTATLSPWLIRNVVNTGSPVFPLARSVWPERAGIWDNERAAAWHDGHLPAPEDRVITARCVAFVQRVVLSSQFGIIVPGAAVAAVALILRRRQRGSVQATLSGDDGDDGDDDASSVLSYLRCVIYMQMIVTVVVWIVATHLVDRFAVCLIPGAAILLGDALSRFRTVIPAAVCIAINLGCLSYRFTPEHPSQQSMLFALGEIAGDTAFMTDGVAVTRHTHVLNDLLRKGQRILIVADARTLYLDADPQSFEYCVVFNRNALAEQARTMNEYEILDWLRGRQIRFVYVDWNEMERLRRSRYGFWPELDLEFFRKLVGAGLRPADDFTLREGGRKYATLFIVPSIDDAR